MESNKEGNRFHRSINSKRRAITTLYKNEITKIINKNKKQKTLLKINKRIVYKKCPKIIIKSLINSHLLLLII